MLTKRPVLLLNSCFEPIRIISVRQALKMLTKGKVTVVLSTKRMIYPGVYQPSVIRLVEYKYIPVRMQVVTKKNIYLRDDHTCQYCSRKFHGSELDSRPRIAPLARRPEHMGKPGYSLQEVQSGQGCEDPGRGRHEALAPRDPCDCAHGARFAAVGGHGGGRVGGVFVR
jgi:hypothetical protein